MRFVLLTFAILLCLVAGVFIRHALATTEAQNHWDDRPPTELTAFGTVSDMRLSVLAGPLPGETADLVTEPGLSLLLEMDERTWLFDLGLNATNGIHTVRHNADAIGADLRSVDAVFLSHRHRDHMGGVEAERSGALDMDGIGRTDTRFYAPPDALAMPGRAVTTIHAPIVLGEGTASLGPIRRALFIGPVDEQALVVDVESYGLVVIVGCGHQTLEKLSARIEKVFGRPPRAVIGDLHYPVPEGRLFIAGIDAQRRLASGSGPFRPVDGTAVDAMLTWAETNKVELYLVGHDTHDRVLAKPAIRPMAVGENISFP